MGRINGNPDKPFVRVIWGDAYGTADQEQHEDEITHEASIYQSYGWLLRSDLKGITLAAEWRPKANNWRGVMFIPRPMVISEDDLSLSKKPSRKVKNVPDRDSEQRARPETEHHPSSGSNSARNEQDADAG